MSKYDELWNYIQKRTKSSVKLTFEEITEIAGVAWIADHVQTEQRRKYSDCTDSGVLQTKLFVC